VEVISGVLPKKARLELLLDGGYWPSFSTERARSLTAKWDQVSEGFVRELDFCGVWLRLNENEEGVRDDIIGETKMSATEFLDLCWVSSLGSDGTTPIANISRRTKKPTLTSRMTEAKTSPPSGSCQNTFLCLSSSSLGRASIVSYSTISRRRR